MRQKRRERQKEPAEAAEQLAGEPVADEQHAAEDEGQATAQAQQAEPGRQQVCRRSVETYLVHSQMLSGVLFARVVPRARFLHATSARLLVSNTEGSSRQEQSIKIFQLFFLSIALFSFAVVGRRRLGVARRR